MKNLKNHKFLFSFTIMFFILGIINIHLSILGIICMALPFYLLFKTKKKTWCQGYCPRASLYTKSAKLKNSKGLKTPLFFTKGKMKWIMLGYFVLSLTFIILTTIAVASGKKPPLNSLRFLMMLDLPFNLPQLSKITIFPEWLTHLSYRFYSMMLTTTTIGLILGLIYKPRTWCTICPVGTLSDSIKKQLL